ncbi:MAG: J domain-containing protein [Pseudomonadota bacterium]
MPSSEYKPRMGFDIRVKPPKSRSRSRRRVEPEADARECEFDGCNEKAVVAVPKSPRDSNNRIWLCAKHAAEHNKNWNYFDGLTSEEAEAAKLASMHGDRPTWQMGKNDRARAAANAKGPAEMSDAHGVFADQPAATTRPEGDYRDGRKLPRLQVKAFQTMDLKVTAKDSDIRKRYAELLKRYHPDSNGGDRSAETQLQEVVKAHQILKKAGFC